MIVARPLRYAPLLAVLTAFVWLVSPAASSKPRGAAAVDFTQPVPSSEQLRSPSPRSERVAERHNGYGLAGPVLYRSRPVEAPRSFDAVGIAGELHALEFRARSDGERWSDWVETDNGDPAFTGSSDEVQIRSRGVPIEGELHYVDVNEAALPAPAPAAALRTAPGPHFISRADWGADAETGGCPPRVEPEFGRVRAGVIHHTVSTNTYTRAEAPAIVLAICRYHRNANGWNDIGYNALVDRFGNLYEGRAGGMARPIVGAHAEGVNSQTTGIAAIGDHRERTVTPRERESIIRYLAWKFDLAGIEATGTTGLLSAGGSTQRTPAGERVRVKPVFSHSDTNYTECAGEALRAQIPGIRRAVQRRIEGPGGGGMDPADPGGGAAPRPRS